MLKYVIAAVLLTAVAAQKRNEDITIVRSESDNKGDGTFSWASELSDGSKSEQSGYIKDGPDPESPIQVIQGSYSYTSPEGELITVKYIADENGFQPEGAHLPTSPPIPEAIQKALDIILRNAGQQTAASNQQPLFRRPSNNRRF